LPNAYNLKDMRRQEWEMCQQAERAYVTMTENWQPRRTQQDAGAASGKRR